LDIYFDGKRTWESLNLTLPDDPKLRKEVRQLAETVRIKREMQLLSAREGLIDSTGGRATFADYAKKRAASSRNLRAALATLEKYKGADTRLVAIDETWLENFRHWLLADSGLKQSTAAIYFANVRSVLRRALRERLIARNPGVNVRAIRATESDKIPLSDDDMRQLTARQLPTDLGKEISRCFLFACNVGFRVSDLRRLTWADVDRSAQAITLRTQKTGAVVCVPLNAVAWGLLDTKALHRHDEKLFAIPPRGSQDAAFATWRKLAGIEKPLGWHCARHRFASAALAGGASLFTVQKLLGHSKSQMTERYAKMNDSLLRDAVDGLTVITLAKAARK
jgi:integrase